MSRHNRRGSGCGWSHSEWRRDEHGREERRDAQWNSNDWRGGPWSYAADGPGFFGGRNFRILSGLRRDPWHGKVSGVCAGIGGYYGIRPKWIRIALIVSLFINLPLTLLGYGIATLLLKPIPDPSFSGQSEVNAGTSATAQRAETKAEEELPPELRFAALKDKFRELEGRTGDIEGLVTSSEFRLRRDFRKMGEGEGDRA
jgi:phage shock protein C